MVKPWCSARTRASRKKLWGRTWSFGELLSLGCLDISFAVKSSKLWRSVVGGPPPFPDFSLQLPKEGAKDAGQRRPIALLLVLYRLWAGTPESGFKPRCPLWGQAGGMADSRLQSLRVSARAALGSEALLGAVELELAVHDGPSKHVPLTEVLAQSPCWRPPPKKSGLKPSKSPTGLFPILAMVGASLPARKTGMQKVNRKTATHGGTAMGGRRGRGGQNQAKRGAAG